MISMWLALIVGAFLVSLFIIWPLIKSKTPKWFAGVILMVMPAISLLWYQHFGASQKLAETWQIQQQVAQAKQQMQQFGTPVKMVQRLESHLQDKPHDDKGWYLLGKLYFDTGHYKKSLHCFQQAYQLKAHDVDYQVAYAQSLFFSHNKKLTKRAQHLLTTALSKQPDNAAAINLLAVNEYLQGHYDQAIKRWTVLLPTYSEDSHDGQALRAMIAKAKQAGQKHL